MNTALVTAAQAALEFLTAAPLMELQAVEDALGENAPLALLEQALATEDLEVTPGHVLVNTLAFDWLIARAMNSPKGGN